MTEKELIHPNERKYLILAILASILMYILLIVSITGIFFLLFFAVLSFFAHGIMLAMIRTNGVRLSLSQFPQIFEQTRLLCEKMEIIKVPDIYVLQSGGVLNAFATRFFGRNMVVLYSEIFELINQNAENELTFILAHELAHIKRRHITKQLLILPAMWIPFLAEAYSRACEYTSDRFGAYYAGNTEAAKNSLTILAIGKSLFRHVNQSEYMAQIHDERGFFVWLSEKISTHPPLPRRIEEINRFQNGEPFKAAKARGCIVVVIIGALIIAASAYGFKVVLDNLDDLGLPDFNNTQTTNSELVSAIIANNDAELKRLISQGENVNAKDQDGWTALDWAIENDNIGAAQILITANADVNHQDNEGMSPLMRASSLGNAEVMKLLIDKGASLNQQDHIGYTPLIYAVSYGQPEAVRLLLDAGADKTLKSSEGLTAQMYAIKYRDQEMADLLR